MQVVAEARERSFQTRLYFPAKDRHPLLKCMRVYVPGALCSFQGILQHVQLPVPVSPLSEQVIE